MVEEYGIGTYPVGLFSDVRRRRFKGGFSYLKHQLQRRNYRAVRNYFNGYLAEWHYRPEEVATYRCGRGWTRKAALRSLGRHIVAANLSERERNRAKN